MPLFDFTDPNMGALMGLLQGAGQAAIPTRVRTPAGATLGMVAGGAMQGARQAQEMKASQIQNEMLARQSQLQGIGVQQYLDSQGQPQAQSSAQPAANGDQSSGLFHRIGQLLRGESGDTSQATPPTPPATPTATVPNLQASQSGLYTTPAKALDKAQLFGLMGKEFAPLAAEYAKLGTAPFIPNMSGGLTATAGGPSDAGVVSKLALAKAAGEKEQIIDPNTGLLVNAPGAVASQAQTAGATSAATESAKVAPETAIANAKEAARVAAEASINNTKQAIANSNTLVSVPRPDGTLQNMTLGDQIKLAQAGGFPAPQAAKGKDLNSALNGSILPAAPAKASGPGFSLPNPEWDKGWQTLQDGAQDNSKTQNLVTGITGIMKKLETNPLANIKSEVYPAMQAIGMDVKPGDIQNAADAQAAMHFNLLSAMSALKGQTSRFTQKELDVTQKAQTNPELLPAANHIIAAHILGALKQDEAFRQTIPEARSIGHMDPNAYSTSWFSKNPTQPYVDDQYQQIGPLKGEPGNPSKPSASISAKDPKIINQAFKEKVPVSTVIDHLKSQGVTVLP